MPCRCGIPPRPGEGRALQGEHDQIALVARVHRKHLGKDRLDALAAAPERGVAPEQVDRHDPGLGQHVMAVLVERNAVEHRPGRLLIVEVDLDDAERAAVAGASDVDPGIGANEVEPLVRRWQPEPPMRRVDDDPADLDDGDLGSGAVVMAELGQRRGAEAELKDPGRGLQEQQPRHHVANIGEFQRHRVGQPRRALHPAAAEVQEPDAVLFRERDRRIRIQGSGMRREGLAEATGRADRGSGSRTRAGRPVQAAGPPSASSSPFIRLTNPAGSSRRPPSASDAWSNSRLDQSSKRVVSVFRRCTSG